MKLEKQSCRPNNEQKKMQTIFISMIFKFFWRRVNY